jgi:hypothetical protein
LLIFSYIYIYDIQMAALENHKWRKMKIKLVECETQFSQHRTTTHKLSNFLAGSMNQYHTQFKFQEG